MEDNLVLSNMQLELLSTSDNKVINMTKSIIRLLEISNNIDIKKFTMSECDNIITLYWYKYHLFLDIHKDGYNIKHIITKNNIPLDIKYKKYVTSDHNEIIKYLYEITDHM